MAGRCCLWLNAVEQFWSRHRLGGGGGVGQQLKGVGVCGGK